MIMWLRSTRHISHSKKSFHYQITS